MAISIQGVHALITGGAGFVGSHLADRLIAAGAERVVAIDNLVRGRRDNLDEAMRSGRLEFIEGDIRDGDLVDRTMQGVDLVFHQAALRITHCASEPVLAVQVMMNGTQNVLEAAVRHRVKKVLAASSASVYGEPSYLPMDEDHPFNNRTLYGGLKIADEQMLRAYADMHDLQYVVLRPFNLYGPRMDVFGVYTEVMVRWLERLTQGQAPVIFGDGKQTMDFVYVTDAADAYLAAATSDATDMALNLGSGIETSLLELCRMMCAAVGRPDLQPILEPPRKVNPVTRRRAAVERAKAHIGFATRVDLAEGLSRLVAWHASLLDLNKAGS
jgi:UDP-glucose 4-epimerase